MKTLRLIIMLAFTLALGAPAWARMPRSREFCGTLTSLVTGGREVVVTAADDQRLAAVWTKDTLFVHDGKTVDASALPKGGRVCIFYRSPFSGPTYLTKVVW